MWLLLLLRISSAVPIRGRHSGSYICTSSYLPHSTPVSPTASVFSLIPLIIYSLASRQFHPEHLLLGTPYPPLYIPKPSLLPNFVTEPSHLCCPLIDGHVFPVHPCYAQQKSQNINFSWKHTFFMSFKSSFLCLYPLFSECALSISFMD